MNRDEPESLAAQAAAWVPPWQRPQPDPSPTPDHPGDEPPNLTGTVPEATDPPATPADHPAPGNEPTADLADLPQPAEVPADAGSDGPLPGSDDAPDRSESLPAVDADTDESQSGSALPEDLADPPDSAPDPAEANEASVAVEGLDGDPTDQDLDRHVPEETDDSFDSERPAAAAESTDPHIAAPAPAPAPSPVTAESQASSNGASLTGVHVDQPSAPIAAQAEDLADAVPATEAHSSEADHQPPLPDTVDLPAALEAILLVVDEPVPEIVLAQVLEQPTDTVAAALTRLSAEYTDAGRGYDLRRAAGGWRLYTRPEYAPYVERFVLDGQQVRLTQASLETLAVVAYKQPVTRSRISAIRGVNCDGVIRTLLTRGLIEECGSEPDTGAHLYRTSMLFCEKLGIDSPADLPPLAPFLPDDVDEIAEAHDQR